MTNDTDCSVIITGVRMADPGLSDDFLVVSDINTQHPKPELQQFSFRDFRSVDPQDFAVNLQMTDAYIKRTQR